MFPNRLFRINSEQIQTSNNTYKNKNMELCLRGKTSQLMVIKMSKGYLPQKTKGKGMGALVIAGLLVSAGAGGTYIYKSWFGDNSGIASSTANELVKGSGATGVVPTLNLNDNIGDVASLDLVGYDREATSQTEVSQLPVGVFKIMDADGNLKLLKDVSTFNTSSNVDNAVVGDQIALFGVSSSYYVDPILKYDVTQTADVIELDAYAIAGESEMVTTVYDDSGNLLTADDDAENDADYSVSLGANQVKLIQPKLALNADAKSYRAKAVAVFYENDIDNFEPSGSDWVKVAMPKEIKDATLTHSNDTTTVVSGGDYDAVYVYKPDEPNSYVDLRDWGNTGMLPFKVTAGTTDPTANTGDIFGGLFLDVAYSEGSDGTISWDIYQKDTSEGVGAVGLDETVTSPQGLQIGFMIEGQ